MKNLKTVASVATVLLAILGVSQAFASKEESHDKVSYNVGADLSVYPSTSSANTVFGGNLFAGARINKNFGLEGGVGFAGSPKTYQFYNISIHTGRVYNVYVDALGYLPIDGTKLDLVGALGLGYATVSYSFSFSDNLINHNARANLISVRAGAGAQYNINQNWSIRGMARFQAAPDEGNVHFSPLNLTLGAIYKF